MGFLGFEIHAVRKDEEGVYIIGFVVEASASNFYLWCNSFNGFRGWEPTNSIEELAAIFSVFFLLVQGKR